MRSTVDHVLRAIFVLCILNFMAFAAVASFIGGDAVSGYSRDGRYFLKSHGTVTEVSPDVFRYSTWHGRSVWVTHPLAFLCVGLIYLRRRSAQIT
jgi:hypothetical protein